MTEDQGSTKWSKLMRQIKGDEEEEDVEDEDVKTHHENTESKDETKEDEASQSVARSGEGVSVAKTFDNVSDSLVMSLQWLDKMCGISPTTKRGQLIYMFIMLLIPLLPILALIAQNIISVNSITLRKNDLMSSDGSILKSDETARLIAGLQKERSATLMQIYLSENASEQVKLDFLGQRLQTDSALENITDWRAPDGELMFRSKLRLQIRIDDFRELIDKRNTTTDEQSQKLAFDALNFYTYATRVLLDDLSTIIRTSNGSKTWRYLVTYKNMLRAIENLGIEISFGIIFIGNGELSVIDFAKYVEKHRIVKEYMAQSEAYLSDMREEMNSIRTSPQFLQYNERYGRMVKEKKTPKENKTAEINIYFQNTYEIVVLLRNSIAKLRMNMNELIAEEIQRVDRDYVVGIAVLVVLVIISPMIVFLIRNAVSALQIFSANVKTKARDLKREKRRADGLIYQMLPKGVADNLRQNKSTSEMFESATICFTEIDGFKFIARNCTPLQLFDLLNTIYKIFDARIDDNDVYKVETINDSYMVASGLPERNGDRHAAEIANLCLELMFITPGIMSPHDPSLRLKIRIGIHTGATTAGVVGSKMPRYCLFGDSVNVASRMQSTGEPMKIQMTYETKMLLDTVGGYKSEVRGHVDVKGKGSMDTYWLLSRT